MNKLSFENFNGKAQIYAQTRSSYSNNYLNIFCKHLVSQTDSCVADIAAGTGINTKLISNYCRLVYAIEPNKDMLNQCRKNCQEIENIKFIEKTSEETGLPNKSVNIITIAQAFQLLDLEKTKKECQRILKKSGKVILIWNSKESKNDFFYETEKVLLQFCPLYKRSIHVMDFKQSSFSNFFSKPPEFYKFIDDGVHFLTKTEFIGRALCASYSLPKSNNNYNAYIDALDHVYDKFSVNGLVYAPLSTIIYVGEI